MGTQALDIGAMRQTSRSFISWHDLRKMRSNPHWDFGITARGSGDLREKSKYLKSRLADFRLCGVSAATDLGDPDAFSRDRTVFFSPVVGDGYNSSNTDPSCLSLLRLTPRQGGREFVRLLSRAPVVFGKLFDDIPGRQASVILNAILPQFAAR